MEGMPLVSAAAVEFQHKDVVVSAVNTEGKLSYRAVPGCVTLSRDVEISASVCDNAQAAIRTIRPMEGMPLVSAAAVEFQHKDVVVSAVNTEGKLSYRAVPGCVTLSRDVEISASVCDNAQAAIRTIRPMEGVPLVSAAAVKFQDKDIAESTVSTEGELSCRPVPGRGALSRDVDVSASVCDNAQAAIRTIRPMEGVPRIGREWAGLNGRYKNHQEKRNQKNQ
jgi:hypothetical protein